MKQVGFLKFFAKSITLGLIVAGTLLIAIPDLRNEREWSWDWLVQSNTPPPALSFNDAIRRAAPAVVNIYSTSYDTRPLYFRRSPIERTSLGSGVIMTMEGHILTSYHVIQNAEKIVVLLQDERILEATLVGSDRHTDLAVLKVEEPNLPVIPQIPDYDSKVGDMVMSIGNPHNLGQTITQGIVSATGRLPPNKFISNFSHAHLIQMDAAIDEGSSGGALIDSNGVLVGINNAKYKKLNNQRQVQEAAGIFFALPYRLAKRVMDEIIAHGRVVRGYLGIEGTVWSGRDGIIVSAIDPEGPAALAGIKLGDVILKVNEVKIEYGMPIQQLIGGLSPGQGLDIEVSRENQIYKTRVITEELPSS